MYSVLLNIIHNLIFNNIYGRHQHYCKLLHTIANRAARSHAVLVIPAAADRSPALAASSRPTHRHRLACIFLDFLHNNPNTSYLHSKMAGKKGAGENSKKAAGQARVCFCSIFYTSFYTSFFLLQKPRPRFKMTSCTCIAWRMKWIEKN